MGLILNTELDALLRQYQLDFPDAESPMANAWNYSPAYLRDILREANGREIVWSYPGLDQGVLDGCAYHYKDAEHKA
jgi:hypothetical protein